MEKKIKTSCSKYGERMPNVICIKLRGKLTDICKVQAKAFYTQLVNKKVKPPSINTWINLFPFLEQNTWKETFLSKLSMHILKVNFKFTVCEVLFGLQLREDPILHITN